MYRHCLHTCPKRPGPCSRNDEAIQTHSESCSLSNRRHHHNILHRSESSFVNLSISGTVGGVIAIPVYEPQYLPGEYTVKLDKKHWPQEVYTISVVLNHDRKRRRARRFTHHAPDRQIASDEQLQQVWSQAILKHEI